MIPVATQRYGDQNLDESTITLSVGDDSRTFQEIENSIRSGIGSLSLKLPAIKKQKSKPIYQSPKADSPAEESYIFEEVVTAEPV